MNLAIFSMPRSGSTFLMRLLNQSNNVLVYGEHGGLLAPIAQLYADAPLVKMNQRLIPALRKTDTFPACWNGVTSENYEAGLRLMIEKTFNPACAPRWGIKEIRYGYGQDKVFEMLTSLYPDIQILFTVRSPIDQIRSKRGTGWWKDDSLEFDCKNWQTQFNVFRSYAQRWPNSRFVCYEHITSNEEYFSDILRYVGLSWVDSMSEVFANKTGSSKAWYPDIGDILKTLTGEYNDWLFKQQASYEF